MKSALTCAHLSDFVTPVKDLGEEGPIASIQCRSEALVAESSDHVVWSFIPAGKRPCLTAGGLIEHVVESLQRPTERNRIWRHSRLGVVGPKCHGPSARVMHH